MKTSKANAGPFKERPYYSEQEMESICCEELQQAGLFPSSPQPIRIERFVEKRFEIVPKYEELPIGLLGFTKFGPNGVEEIVVSRFLADDGSVTAERRINTTLAHEAGHALLHTHLFAMECNNHTLPLFRENIDCSSQKILCRTGDDIESIQKNGKPRGYDGRWWEYQANRMIGALLLPRSLVMRALEPLTEKQGLIGLESITPSGRPAAIDTLADIFDVNPAVARIRLEGIFPSSENKQLTL